MCLLQSLMVKFPVFPLFHFLLSSTQADRTHEKKPMSWGKLSIKRWMVRAEMFAKTTPRISSRICWYSGVLKLSDRWIGGKILTGNHGFSNEIWVCPVNVPLISAMSPGPVMFGHAWSGGFNCRMISQNRHFSCWDDTTKLHMLNHRL